ncbi:hypothetical protein ABZX85_15725 [Streptomyces sp. NPDC004539]|uniref:hypothetical protein n=1 Tax=Streptomyces sp. NPDC004539 TaxID=3154280 RepID=UPI0033B893D2
MTITAAKAPPQHDTLVDLVRGVLTGAVVGGSLSAFVVGIVIEKVPLIVASLAVPAVYGLLLFLVGGPRRAREAAVVPRTALAMIESVEAIGSEHSDVPVKFEVSVVPEDGPGYRVRFRQDINLAELPAYRPRGVVVVEYPPDTLWKMRIVKRPTPEWEERAAAARLDSVPGPVVEANAAEGCALGCLTVLALLLAAAGVVFAFRGDLFDSGPASPSSSSSSSSSSSDSRSQTDTTVVTSSTGTLSLGPGQSMLDAGELRRSVESLTQGGTKGEALSVVVQERLLTVVFSPSGAKGTGFDPRSLPFDRVPALVEQAGSGLGTRQSWQLTAAGTDGNVTLRVSVTGSGGAGSLEADGQGNVVRHSGS